MTFYSCLVFTYLGRIAFTWAAFLKQKKGEKRSAHLVPTRQFSNPGPVGSTGRVQAAVQNSMDRPQVARARGLGGSGAPQTREPRPFFFMCSVVPLPSPILFLHTEPPNRFSFLPTPFSKRRTRRTPGPLHFLGRQLEERSGGVVSLSRYLLVCSGVVSDEIIAGPRVIYQILYSSQ